jgi:hypothetical protein
MATPIKDDIKTLDYTYYGMPYAPFDNDSTVQSKSLDITYYGMPFVVNQLTSAALSASIKLVMMI